MRCTIKFSLLLLIMMPTVAKAAVIINEIAWMGDSISANHEWIELHNNGEDIVSLDGWVLKDGLNLEILLSGSVRPKDYAVLERTSEESAPGTAFLIYTGALVNSGATLTLYKEDGQIVDQVAGGENWNGVGGDNATKETAQYTNNGWVTDEATPGAVNKTGRTEEPEPVDETPPTTSGNNNGSNVTKDKVTSKSEPVRLVVLDTELKLKTDFQTLAYVNQPVNFLVKASGIGQNIINSLSYTWNFGDTKTATTKKAIHSYAYPGTYVVTLRASYARHNQVVRQNITILPVTFSITKNDVGDIQVNNDSPYDVELSGFVVKGTNEFVFPPDTIIIPRGTITIEASKLGVFDKTQLVTLFDQEKKLVASSLGDVSSSRDMLKTMAVASINETQVSKINQTKIAGQNDTDQVKAYDFVKPMMATSPSQDSDLAVVDEDLTTLTKTSPGVALVAQASAVRQEHGQAKPAENNSNWTYIALIGLLFLGFVGLLLRPNKPGEE